MGNCLRHQSSMRRVSSDESLGAPADQFSIITRDVHAQEKVVMMNNIQEEKEGILNGGNDDKNGAIRGNNLITSSVSSTTSSTSSSSTAKVVKIKITKKQLLELLGKVEVAELSMQQILSQLMNVTASDSHKSSSYEAYNPRSWMPDLQSIPE